MEKILEAKDAIVLALQIMTLTLSFLNYLSVSRMHKVSNNISVITKSRSDRYQKLTEYCSEILYNANYLILAKDYDVEYAKIILNKTAAIELMLHLHFRADKSIIDTAKNITCLAFELCQDHACIEKTDKLREEAQKFASLCDPFLETEWSRIKIESSGKKMEFEDWKTLYRKNISQYNRAKQSDICD